MADVAVQWGIACRRACFALDTGASHTVADLNFLYHLDLIRDGSYHTAQARTGNGVVEGLLITLDSFTALGRRIDYFEVFAYDFLQAGAAEVYDGLIGLDFLDGGCYYIDMINNYIEII